MILIWALLRRHAYRSRAVRSTAGGGWPGWFGRRAGQGRCPVRLPGQECCCGLTRWVTRC